LLQVKVKEIVSRKSKYKFGCGRTNVQAWIEQCVCDVFYLMSLLLIWLI